MSINAGMEQAIELLVELQGMDRIRDRLQRKLDQVPKKLKSHTDGIAILEVQAEEQGILVRSAKMEADRAELEVVAAKIGARPSRLR